MDGISFLAADVSSTAFGRGWPPDGGTLRLDAAEIVEFDVLVEETIARYRDDFESGFVAESPETLRRLPKYYAALDASAAAPSPFPPVACNAPWVSVVLEADGSVRPCFFHDAIGNVRRTPLASILAEQFARLSTRARRVDQRGVPALRLFTADRMAERAMAVVSRTPLEHAATEGRRPGSMDPREPDVRPAAEEALLDTQLAFDGVASTYDRSNVENRILRGMRSRVLAAVGRHVPVGSRILDLGCGPGGDDEQLARHGYLVTAIDWSPAMVEQARRRVRTAGVADRVEVRHLGIHQLDQLASSDVRRGVFEFRAAQLRAQSAGCGATGRGAASSGRRAGGVRDRAGLSVGNRVLWASPATGRGCASGFSAGLVPVPLRRAHGLDAVRHAGIVRARIQGRLASAVNRCVRWGCSHHRPTCRRLPIVIRRSSAWLQQVDDRAGACPGLRAWGDHFLVVLRKA